MHIRDIRIRDFRSIEALRLTGLGHTVLLFGDNNAGKSNLMDAAGLWLRAVVLLLAEESINSDGTPNLALFRPRGARPEPVQVFGDLLRKLAGERWRTLVRRGAATWSIHAELVLDDGSVFWMTIDGAPGRAGEERIELWASNAALDGRDLMEGDGQPDVRQDAVEQDEERTWRRLARGRVLSGLGAGWMKMSAERRFYLEGQRPSDRSQFAAAPDPGGQDLKSRLEAAVVSPSATLRKSAKGTFPGLVAAGGFDIASPPTPSRPRWASTHGVAARRIWRSPALATTIP